MTLPDKKEVCDQILRNGVCPSLFVHFDPRHKDVVVPPWLRHQAQLVLQVGYDMWIPIPDLRVDETGIGGTLSFDGTQFKCFVPWYAVFAARNSAGKGMVWPDSMPIELQTEAEAEAKKSSTVPAKKKKKKVETKVVVAAGPLPRTKSGKLLPIGWRVIEGGKGGGDYGNAS